MFRKAPSQLLITAAIGTILITGISIVLAYQEHPGFRDTLVEYIDRNARSRGAVVRTPAPKKGGEASPDALEYEKGDWEAFIVAPKYRLRAERGDQVGIEDQDDVNMISYGSMKANLVYGKSKFTRGSYQQYDTDKAVSKVIKSGFYPERETQLHLEGNVGKRMTLLVDHDSRKLDNTYVMKYRAVRDDELIREINAGEIDIKMNNSKYAVYDDSTAKGLGIDMTIRKDRLKLKLFGSVVRGQSAVETFRGNSSANHVNLREYQYMRNRYFQLEPFRRYDGLTSAPAQNSTVYSTVALSSNPATPSTFAPYAVNIDTTGFELYMDDANSANNTGGITISVDNGYYNRMVSGVDYTINFTTGLISFKRTVPDNARIFAVYTLNGGSTVSSDWTARTDVFTGKLFVFIKYGYSINEDPNRNFGGDVNGVIADGKLNLDIYEVRSFYRIGEQQILNENFRIDLYLENSLLTAGESAKTGKYQVDSTSGIIQFNLREPFRQLLGSNATVVYQEAPISTKSNSSRYVIKVNYYREARSFQLQHSNIIAGSVRVRINGRELASSLYSVDNTSGFFQFTDPNNPVIASDTNIEIRYEYLPPGGQSQSFAGGMRADYEINRNLNIGGTFLFSRGASGTNIPNVGAEASQVMVFEADAKLYLGREKLRELINTIPGVELTSMPFTLSAYAEYARSYKNVNTFGKALIDDMESSDDVVSISLNERDWILASPPSSGLQTDRGHLYYYYYRNPSSPDSLQGPTFSASAIPYATKPGPYNIATGHVSNDVRATDSQRSLVLNFDFQSGSYVSSATRRLSSSAIDFSGLQYIEVWYRSTGGTGTVDLALDVGRVNEDSDGDGVLDTEDTNSNGFLDADPVTGIFEDRGYVFNPSGGTDTRVGSGPMLTSATQGDGILDSEDLNGNGTLDTIEQVIRFPGTTTTLYNGETVSGIDMSNTAWRRARIYFNRNSAAYKASSGSYDDIMRQVSSLRLSVIKGTASTGTIYIDTIKFVSSRWTNIKIDDAVLYAPDAFKVTIVDTYSDSEYRANAFIFNQRDVYTSLHGQKSTRELNQLLESALSIEYNLATLGAHNGSVTRKFTTAMDLRFYKTLSIWCNFRQFTAGDTVGIRVGSSENNYVEYRFSMEYPGLWREIQLRLKDSSSGTVSAYTTVGNPDFKRINFIQFIVYSTASGKIYVDDIYVSEPDTLRDSAYWYETEINSKEPLARTASGVPILSDINIKFITKGNGAQYSTVGQTSKDLSEQYHQIFSSMRILPNLSARLDYIAERSSTDSLNESVSDDKRGDTNRQSLYFETHYLSETNAVPSVKVMYKQESYENIRQQFISDYTLVRERKKRSYAPAMMLEEKVADVLGGSFSATMLLDTYFSNDTISRRSDVLTATELSALVTPEEIEKRQKGTTRLSMNFQNKLFYIQPTVDMYSQEIVRLSGKASLSDTTVRSDVEGGYHIPFVSNTTDYRLVERNKTTELKVGWKAQDVITPSMRINMYYLENNFRDYTDDEKKQSLIFERAKSARSYTASRIDIPVNLGRYPALKKIENLVVSYSRTLYLQESEIPYEGEGESFLNEEYGINRTLGKLAGPGINLVSYAPWHFLRGRGNFAGGRDYTYRNLNSTLYYPDGSAVQYYTNTFRLIDTFSLGTTVSFDAVKVNYSAGLNHVSERTAINSVPQQVVTLTSSANLSFDLMQILHFGFFRPNGEGLAHHSGTMSTGCNLGRNMIITSNVEEDTCAPSLGFTFRRDRASFGLRGSVEFRNRRNHEYIDDDVTAENVDYVYVTNLAATNSFHEIDKGYNFSVLFETDVIWMSRLFGLLYELAADPIWSIEYSMLLNRYNYSTSASPEPYDQYLLSSKLTLDLHRNIRGGLVGRCAYEQFRNRETNNVYRKIVSYELGVNFTLLF